ncbi:MAG: fibronectin type III domain-containing protein [Alphaproteobacteria bacterium]|nr:fibronectin type III domain-containing protein [Alphaproteobacteria bacterium]MBV9671124.1 fibronectin type III domain-containing protein [Terriglobales bacterium]
MQTRTATWILAIAITGAPVALSAQASSRPQAERITNGPVVEGTGDSWAVIAWSTNAGGSTVVKYGTDRNRLDQTAEASYADNEKSQGQVHRVHIKNLQPNTTYYYQVTSGQGEGTGTQAQSPVETFKTKGNGGGGSMGAHAEGITSGPVVEKAAGTYAIVAWGTNTGGSSLVRYGTDPNNLSQVAESAYDADRSSTQGVTHRVTIKNLKPNTTYYYQVDSGQGQGTGTEAKGKVESFKTAAQ